MGINPGKSSNKKNFAVEVLKVEISGPTRSHFSILDVPGIFSNDFNVKEGEMSGVRNLVIEYMKQPESIVMYAQSPHDEKLRRLGLSNSMTAAWPMLPRISQCRRYSSWPRNTWTKPGLSVSSRNATY